MTQLKLILVGMGLVLILLDIAIKIRQECRAAKNAVIYKVPVVKRKPFWLNWILIFIGVAFIIASLFFK